MRELYFKDNFFSSGITTIMDVSGQYAGELDLQGAFSSSLSVYGPDREKLYHGRFPFLSPRWEVSNCKGELLGRLRGKMSMRSKKYEYDTGARGIYIITSPLFSKEYSIEDELGNRIATFKHINGWLQSRAYRLVNEGSQLGDYELVTVVMGVYELEKRSNDSGAPMM